MRRRLATAALAACCLPAAGCLVVTGSASSEHGVLVTQSTLEQIEPGVTTEDWLLATLGEPTSRRAVKDEPGVEILRYEHKVREESGGTVFLLFAGGKSHKHRRVAYFEVADGVVTRAWVEDG